MTRADAEKRVLKEFRTRPPRESLDWFVDGYLHMHRKKPAKNTGKKA